MESVPEEIDGMALLGAYTAARERDSPVSGVDQDAMEQDPSSPQHYSSAVEGGEGIEEVEEEEEEAWIQGREYMYSTLQLDRRIDGPQHGKDARFGKTSEKPNAGEVIRAPLHKTIPSFFAGQKSKLGASLELDLSLKRDAVDCVTSRESVIERLKQVAFKDPMTTKSHISRLLQELTNCGLSCVESIESWRIAATAKGYTSIGSATGPNAAGARLPPIASNDGRGSSPEQRQSPHVYFRWRGHNYLLKMLTDLDFISSMPSIMEVLPRDTKISRNPFLLEHNVDELNLLKRDDHNVEGRADIFRARKASRVILMEEKEEAIRNQREEDEKDRSAARRRMDAQLHDAGDFENEEDVIDIDNTLPPAPSVNTRELKVFSKLSHPPLAISMILACIKILLTPSNDLPALNRKVLRAAMRKPLPVISRLKIFNPNLPIKEKVLEALSPVVTNPKFSPEAIKKMSESIGSLTAWLKDVVVEKCLELGWRDGKPVYSAPVTPYKPASPPPDSPSDSDNSDSDSERQNANVYVEMLQHLREEISSLKRTLSGQGLIKQLDDGESSLPYRDDASHTSSLLSAPTTSAVKASSSTVHLSQESIKLEGTQVIVKVQYLHSGATLLFTAWDPIGNKVVRPAFIPSLFCDQVTSFSPVELEAMPESFRRQKLRPLVDMLSILTTPSLDSSAPPISRLHINIDRVVCSGSRSLEDVDYSYEIRRTRDNDGLTICFTMTSSSPPSHGDGGNSDGDGDANGVGASAAPLTLQISDAELELLLAHQPGLYLRSQRKWSSQKAICEWLATRILVMKDEKDSSPYLAVDRNVPVPRNVEEGQTKEGTKYKLQARQFNNDIILEALPPQADGTISSSSTPHFPQRPMSRVKIGLAEFQSLGAPENIPQNLDNFPNSPSSGANADGVKNLDLGRPPRTPLDSLLSRLSWSMKNGQPILGINRVVYHETLVLSGNPVTLRASVMNRDIIFQATRLRINSDEVGGVESDQYERVGEDLIKLVTEDEAETLLNDEADSRRQFLMQPPNRSELCRVLSLRLKLVKSGNNCRLETFLYREKSLLTIAIDSSHSDNIIGAVDVDDQTTLSSLRQLIVNEMDEEDVPTSFRFFFQGAPISRNQELTRLASTLLPVAVILSKTKTRRRRPGSAPNKHATEDDSEFGSLAGAGGGHSWDSDSAGSSKTSMSRRKRRKKRAKRMRKKHLVALRSAKAHSDDDFFLDDIHSDLSDDSNFFDEDSDDYDNDSDSLSLSKGSASTHGTKMSKKKKKKKKKKSRNAKAGHVVTTKRGSIIEKKVVVSGLEQDVSERAKRVKPLHI